MSKDPWFQDRGIGTVFSLPVSIFGWLALLGMVVLLLATAWLPKDEAIPARIVIVVIYLVFSFFKTERL